MWCNWKGLVRICLSTPHIPSCRSVWIAYITGVLIQVQILVSCNFDLQFSLKMFSVHYFLLKLLKIIFWVQLRFYRLLCIFSFPWEFFFEDFSCLQWSSFESHVICGLTVFVIWIESKKSVAANIPPPVFSDAPSFAVFWNSFSFFGIMYLFFFLLNLKKD